jgi:hypothetical protein
MVAVAEEVLRVPSAAPIDPGEIQRWFAHEATAMWRRIKPGVNERPGGR